MLSARLLARRLLLGAVLACVPALLLALFWAGVGPTAAQEDEAQPPAKPAGLRVATEAGSLDASVDWDEVAGADSYLVRWRVAGSGNRLNEGVEVSASHAVVTVDASGGWVVRV